MQFYLQAGRETTMQFVVALSSVFDKSLDSILAMPFYPDCDLDFLNHDHMFVDLLVFDMGCT